MGNKKCKLISTLIFFSFSINSYSEYDPDDLINAFGPKCSSYGALTQTALNEANTIKATLKTLRDDPDCKSAMPCLSNNLDGSCNTDLVSENLKALEAQKNNPTDVLSNKIENLKAAIALEMQNGDKADQTWITTLQDDLRTTNKDLLEAKANVQFKSNKKDINALISFYKNSSQLMTSLSQNQLCATKKGNLITKVGAQILSVSSEWVSGLGGSALMAVGGIVDQLVQLVRDSKINRDIKGIINSKLELAIGCTLEGLSTTYCQARDLQLVIKQNAQFQSDNSCTFNRGLNLLQVQMKSYLDSMDALVAGSAASSDAQLQEKKGAFELESNNRKLQMSVVQKLLKGSKAIETAKPENKENERKNLIKILTNSLAAEVGGGGGFPGNAGDDDIGVGSLSKIFVDDPQCGTLTYYYSSGTDYKCRKAMGEDCMSCIEKKYPKTPSFEEISTRTDELLQKSKDFVSGKILEYQENNPSLALGKMFVTGANGKKGIEFLKDTSTYLDLLLKDENGISRQVATKNLIKNTKNRVDDALKIIQEKVVSGMSDADALTVNSNLKEVLTKGNDTYLIPRALSTIIKEDLNDKINSKSFDQNLVVALQLSSSDNLSEILSNYKGKEFLRNQARGAKSITIKNISALTNVFGNDIEKNIINLSNKYVSEKNQDTKEDLQLACMRTLLIPEGPSQKVKDVCRWQVYKPLIQNQNDKGKNTILFSEYVDKPYENRACVLYDFYRKQQITEMNSVRSGK